MVRNFGGGHSRGGLLSIAGESFPPVSMKGGLRTNLFVDEVKKVNLKGITS